jgi:hypothetical protein
MSPLLNSAEEKQDCIFLFSPLLVFGLCVAGSVLHVFADIALAKATSSCGLSLKLVILRWVYFGTGGARRGRGGTRGQILVGL